MKQSFKRMFGILILFVSLMVACPSYAWIWKFVCWPVSPCFWIDVGGLAARLANIAASYKLMKTEIDATAGFEKIKNNIGMGEGPGISATGASGANLVTEEEGAQMQAEQAERAATIPDIIVNLFTDAEENEKGEGFRAIREANAQLLLSDYCSECTQRSTTTGECLKYTQRLCTEAEQVAINQGCDACLERNDQGQCIAFDSASCARERQNYWLIQSVNGAEGILDAHADSARNFYEDLQKLLKNTSASTTVSAFWSDLQRFSVQANTIVPEITFVYAMDLLSTSERRVSEVGVELEVFPKQDEEEDDS